MIKSNLKKNGASKFSDEAAEIQQLHSLCVNMRARACTHTNTLYCISQRER